MENNKKTNQAPEIKEEELDQVSGGVIIPGKPPVTPPAREKPIGEEPAKSSRN